MRRALTSGFVAAALTAAVAAGVGQPLAAQTSQVEAAQAALQGRSVDLSGTWANRLHEDSIERAPGPHIGDYTGLPINDEARAIADAYQVSMQNMPERQCILYSSHYIVLGPQNLRIEQELDPISGSVRVYRLSGTVDRAPHVIYMDGRPHPSASAPHTPGGFSTGVWEGQQLKVRTTHLKASMVWRNGVPHSDRATMTEYYIRHGNMLTLTMILEDPVYFEEPFIRNATFELDANTRVLPEPCEPQVEIPRAAGEVPHYLPGANPYLNEFATMYNLPLEAARGGAMTTYPEYAKRLRATYRSPATCPVYCCTGTTIGAMNNNRGACREDDAPATPAAPPATGTPAPAANRPAR